MTDDGRQSAATPRWPEWRNQKMVKRLSASARSTWRFRLGLVCFTAAFAIHLISLVAIALGASAATVSAITAVNFALNKFLLLASAAIMGKAGFAELKQTVFGALKQYTPPHEVGPMRYRFGLILFVIPIFLGWVAPYVDNIAPYLGRSSVRAALLGDLALLVSLFVLGGNFWDKLRALFDRNAKVVLPN